MDTENVGVAGYSWDGFFSLALSGVRIDPEFYRILVPGSAKPATGV